MTALRPGHWDISELQGSPRRRSRERLVGRLAFAAAAVSILISVGIVYALLFEAIQFMADVDWSRTWGQIGWIPRQGYFDLPTILVATFWVTLIAMIVAAPLGLAAAIYLSEYADARVRRVLKPILEILAGIPSVVLGYFALRFIAPDIVGNLFSGAAPANLMAAGIGVGLLTIPLVASISEDALAAVPGSLREASAGLGARKRSTSLKIVLPAALSGLTAALIVAVSRAIGETMVVYIAGGAADSAVKNFDPTQPGLTMTAAMASVASGTDNVAGVGPTFQSLFFVGLLLFIITLLLNLVADRFVRRFRQEY
ncbi:MAG: phosphate ABC transporter permease subunit PstC [Acidimicrobiia bacterium]|nr:phosphate ABC transporter permease subunit PstC [Acidimicrobiia bacterium]